MVFDGGHVLLFVALETDLTAVFDEKRRLGRLVGVMATGTIAIARGVVPERGFVHLLLQILVALEAEFPIGQTQELLLI
jgi:hypothetical protein